MTSSGVDNRSCFICGSTDHLILTCNRRVYKEGASHYCFVCGDPNHLAKVCPLRFDLTAVAVVKKSGHFSEIICYKCGRKGHKSLYCYRSCLVCGVMGHRAEDCSERMCPICGELGHSTEECPEILCYKCRQLGHHGRLCYRPVAIYGSSRGGDVVGYPVEDGCSGLDQGDCVKKMLPTKAPVVIDISSSSESEDEEERELLCVDKYNTFLDVKVKAEEKNSREKDGDDCCILDFDPLHISTINFKDRLSLSNEDPFTFKDDDEISITGQRGQVACRDYPHSRHQCGNFPFDKTAHEIFCSKCYCYVCDVIAPCAQWTESGGHCHATDRVDNWTSIRRLYSLQI